LNYMLYIILVHVYPVYVFTDSWDFLTIDAKNIYIVRNPTLNCILTSRCVYFI
jgi:hypothetical protein